MNKNSLKVSDFNGVGEEDHSENLLQPVLEKWHQKKSEITDENYKKNSKYYEKWKTWIYQNNWKMFEKSKN